MDLLDDDRPAQNAPEFTVSEISGAVKKTLESAFGRVRVRGEIGRVMRANSGHLYYDLKDERNVISCNTWKGQVSGLGQMPEEGLEVIVTGKLSSFGGQSRYNINVDTIEVAGEGALMALLEKRKKAMQAEGLFDPARKKPIPYLPEIIGVVTSPQGAVIRDILHRLRERFPRKVLIWPVAVQGEACAPQVAAAIEGFNALTRGGALPRPDLLIVARGGGSIEDLWGFNEEVVARAAAASDIPLISAVGHETDTTLIDFVSDKRAPTPTAAAEMAVPVRMDLIATVESYEARLQRALATQLERRRDRLRDLSRALPKRDDIRKPFEQRLDLALARLAPALQSAIGQKRAEYQQTASPLRPAILSQQRTVLRNRLDRSGEALGRALLTRTERGRAKLDQTMRGLSPARLSRDLEQTKERLARTQRGFATGALRQIKTWQEKLQKLDRMRETLGYQATLDRGYAVVWAGDQLLTSSVEAKKTPPSHIQFKDGDFKLDGSSPATTPRPSTKRKSSSSDSPAQSSLFDD